MTSHGNIITSVILSSSCLILNGYTRIPSFILDKYRN
ncbi:DEHA2D14366p [Debaryomyces hansenii CBS767]|uniref:DEHA2D14366p n=1 Tax=Debaryomyces hansenii (strain ATCC 36239 / CBS 767 / BCRC 21394 / JCM 1990 / NBRC 0083 / IGC 2968) TaxID=284592 RepID=B5RTI0_DEBHA|nr:DEHA2D14366p [Debaryomyces hansenii CBS767]CAR65665.1 DEHA2D14366p [Debaryomyces hansenii CBS767]|eukprot:XP_002770311.1 DEHA2D14366p [Debaryomyces hansenii CBS767]